MMVSTAPSTQIPHAQRNISLSTISARAADLSMKMQASVSVMSSPPSRKTNASTRASEAEIRRTVAWPSDVSSAPGSPRRVSGVRISKFPR